MPLHPHECPCGHAFEVLVLSPHADPDPTCPACGGKAERRYGVPLLKTNTSYFTGDQHGAGQFAGDRRVEDLYVGTARRAGVSVNGKRYMHGLARYPGDPSAWVNDLGDAKRILQERGWGCDELGVKTDARSEAATVPIAPDIVEERLDTMVETGEIAPHEKAAKREEVADRLTPHFNKPGAVSKPKRPGRKSTRKV